MSWFRESNRHSLASKGIKTATKGKPSIDLNRYEGKWYDVGHYPTWYQEDCEQSIADYDYQPRKERVKVKNTCIDKEGNKTDIEGNAAINDDETLSVSFFPPFSSPYKIEWVSKDYTRAVVGHPDKKNLWFLSRKQKITPSQLREMKAIAKKKGYAPSKLTNKKITR